MQEEMDSLQDRKVWDLVNLPPGHTPVKGDGFMLSKVMVNIRHTLLQKDLHRSMEKTLKKPSLQLQDLNLFDSSSPLQHSKIGKLKHLMLRLYFYLEI